jgi:hypothetical protein
MGIELFPLNSKNLVHSGGATIYSIMTPAERMEITKENRKKFEDYWVKGIKD